MKLLTSLGPILLLVSFHSTSNELIVELQSCKQIENSLQRLTCFDKATKTIPPTIHVKTKVATQDLEPESSKEVVLSEQKTKGSFGLEHKKMPGELADTLTGTVVLIQKDPYKRLIFTLKNGQIWKQTDNERFRIEEEDNVLIKRGSFNSFFLGKLNNNKRIRVKRVK